MLRRDAYSRFTHTRQFAMMLNIGHTEGGDATIPSFHPASFPVSTSFTSSSAASSSPPSVGGGAEGMAGGTGTELGRVRRLSYSPVPCLEVLSKVAELARRIAETDLVKKKLFEIYENVEIWRLIGCSLLD